MPSWVPDLHGKTYRWGAIGTDVKLWDNWSWYNPDKDGIPMLRFASVGVPVADIEEGGRALRVRGFRVSRIK